MVFRQGTGEPSGGSLIQSILRYRGAGNKEGIRDADRELRQRLAASYAAEQTRVQAVARRLADDRRLDAIAPVDEFNRALGLFIDKLRTATYGYQGLMAELDPEPGAADQLRRFDQSLASGLTEVSTAADALEMAIESGGDLAAPARQGTAAARSLLARFELRGQVVETGKPVPQDSALKALEPSLPDLPHTAWNLDLGVALAVMGDDAVVDAKIGVSGGDGGFRLFRLAADPEEWLFVPKDNAIGLARLRVVAAPGGGNDALLDGVSFVVAAEGDGTGEAVGASGGSGQRPVRFRILRGETEPVARGLLLDWGNDCQAFAGRAIHADDIDIFGPPLGE
jgi:hypothetical protein